MSALRDSIIEDEVLRVLSESRVDMWGTDVVSVLERKYWGLHAKDDDRAILWTAIDNMIDKGILSRTPTRILRIPRE